MKILNIFLGILILIGLGLLFTQSYWVPTVVDMILEMESPEASPGETSGE